ncbi:MAG: hypothetical protein ACI843_000869, partial [Psychrobacter glaciei]
ENNAFSTVTGSDWLTREIEADSLALVDPFEVVEQEAGWLISHPYIGSLDILVKSNGDFIPLEQLNTNQWYLPYQDLNQLDIEYLGEGIQGNETLVLLNIAANSDVSIMPNTSALRMNSTVPVVVTATSGSRVTDVTLNAQKQAIISNLGWQQLIDVPENLLDVTIATNGEETLVQYLALDNTQEGRIDILAPLNNQSFYESSFVNVKYNCQNINDVRYTKVILEDFNGLPIKQSLLNSCDVDFDLRLPSFALAENLYIKVITYFGDEYQFTESRVGIKVLPVSKSVNANIEAPAFVLANSQLSISRNSNDNSQSALLLIQDDQNNVLAASEDAIDWKVDSNLDSFVVKSWVSDGKGNTDTQSYSVQVINPLSLEKHPATSQYTQLIPRIGDSWFVNDRIISNSEGSILIETNSNIIQAALLGNRLIVLLEAGIEIYDSELNFQRVAYHPMVGVTGFIHNGSKMWLWSGSKLTVYSIFGNDLKFVDDDNLSRNIINADFLDGKPVLQLTDKLYSISHNSYISFEDNIQWIKSFNDEIWIQTESGQLFSVNNQLSRTDYGLKPQGISAFNMAGYLAWLDITGSLWLSSNHLNDSLQVLGSWKVSEQGADIATLSNGKLHLSTGEAWSIKQDDRSREAFLDSSKQGGSVSDLQWYKGKLYVAGDYYGAYSLLNNGNQWSLDNASAPYSEKSKHVIATSKGLLLSSVDNTRVNLVQSGFTNVESLFRNIDPVHLSTNGDLVAVTNGTDILINSLNSRDEISYKLPGNTKIQSMSWVGRVLWITSDNGNLYELYLKDWPLNEYDLQLISHDVQLSSPVIEMQATAGKIWLREENALQYYDTQLKTLNNVTFSDGQVTAISQAGNLLWVAYETDSNSIVRSIDMNTNVWGQTSYEYTKQVTAIDVNAPYMAVGFIDGDLRIEHLSNARAGQVSVELNNPSPRQRYQYAQQWETQLPWSANAVASNVLINGQVHYGLSESQPLNKDLVPGWLLNGQAVKFEVETQDIYGRIHKGSTLTTLLQSQSLPDNDMTISLSFDGTSYYPAPLVMEAKIENTQQPIQLVEYYISQNQTGPFELIAKHRGPQFVLTKNFDLSKDGHWVKARAIDLYGNFTESEAKVISRQLDSVAPVLSGSLSGQAVVNQATVVSQSPYLLNVTAADTQSGMQSILLYRNDQLVKAIFENGNLGFEDISHQFGEDINYLIKAKDISENETQINKIISSIENQAPELSYLGINSKTIDTNNSNPVVEIIEGGMFRVDVIAKDDVALKMITTRWVLQKQDVSTDEKSKYHTFRYNDQRSERVVDTVVDNLNILLTDSTDKQTEINIPISVIRDQAPVASNLLIDIPQSGIYGQSLSIKLSGINTVDDNESSQIYFQLLQKESNGNFSLIKTVKGTSRDVQHTSITMPANEIDNNNYEFKIRVLDRLDQFSETGILSVPLTKRPNQVRYTASGTHNQLSVTPDANALYQVLVLDDVSRPVPNQNIKWAIKSRATDQMLQLGITQTDTLGMAELLLDTSMTKGSYLLTAKLANYSDLEPAQLPIAIEAGQLSAVRVNYAQEQEVGDSMHVSLTPVDKGGNTPNSSINKLIELTLPKGFHFSFSDQLNVEVLIDGREKTSISMSNQSVELDLGTAELVGDYQLEMIGIDYIARLINAQWQQVNELPITLKSAQANDYIVQPNTLTTDHNPGSRVDVLEPGDIQGYGIKLVDRFGNLVSKVPVAGNMVNTNYQINIMNIENSQVLGSSVLVSGQANIDALFNDVGINNLQINAENGAPVSLVKNFTEQVSKKLPYIEDAALNYADKPYKPSLNLIFSEAIEAIAPVDLTALLELMDIDSTIYNVESYEIQENIFKLEYLNPIPLGKEFSLATSGSQLQGTAEKDSLYEQQLSIQSPDIFLEDISNGYQVIGTDLQFKAYMRTDKIISTSLASWSNGSQTAINLISNEQIVSMPWDNGNAISIDGAPQLLTVNVQYQSGEIAKLANQPLIQFLSADGDFDGDNLSNLAEYNTGVLNPLIADTDGNGINDDIDDLDQDGLSNGFEIDYGTDISKSDTDNDGLTDLQESQLGTKASGEGSDDSDNDGIPDYVEYQSLSNPTDANEAVIDPFFVTEVRLVQSSRSFVYEGEVVLYTPEVNILFKDGDYERWINVTGKNNTLIYEVTDVSVAEPTTQGINIINPGEITLTVSLLENPAINDQQSISVRGIDNDQLRLEFMDINMPKHVFANVEMNAVYIDMPYIERISIHEVRLGGETITVDTHMGQSLEECAFRKYNNDDTFTVDIEGCDAALFSYEQVHYDDQLLNYGFGKINNDHRMVLYIGAPISSLVDELILEVDVIDYNTERTETFSLAIPVVENTQLEVSTSPEEGFFDATQGLYIKNDDINPIEIGLTINGLPLENENSENFNANSLENISVESSARFYGFKFINDIEIGSAALVLETNKAAGILLGLYSAFYLIPDQAGVSVEDVITLNAVIDSVELENDHVRLSAAIDVVAGRYILATASEEYSIAQVIASSGTVGSDEKFFTAWLSSDVSNNNIWLTELDVPTVEQVSQSYSIIQRRLDRYKIDEYDITSMPSLSYMPLEWGSYDSVPEAFLRYFEMNEKALSKMDIGVYVKELALENSPPIVVDSSPFDALQMYFKYEDSVENPVVLSSSYNSLHIKNLLDISKLPSELSGIEPFYTNDYAPYPELFAQMPISASIKYECNGDLCSSNIMPYFEEEILYIGYSGERLNNSELAATQLEGSRLYLPSSILPNNVSSFTLKLTFEDELNSEYMEYLQLNSHKSLVTQQSFSWNKYYEYNFETRRSPVVIMSNQSDKLKFDVLDNGATLRLKLEPGQLVSMNGAAQQYDVINLTLLGDLSFVCEEDIADIPQSLIAEDYGFFSEENEDGLITNTLNDYFIQDNCLKSMTFSVDPQGGYLDVPVVLPNLKAAGDYSDQIIMINSMTGAAETIPVNYRVKNGDTPSTLVDFEDETSGPFYFSEDGGWDVTITENSSDDFIAYSPRSLSDWGYAYIETMIESEGGTFSFDFRMGNAALTVKINNEKMYEVTGNINDVFELDLDPGRHVISLRIGKIDEESYSSFNLNSILFPAVPDSDGDGEPDAEYYYTAY